MKVKYVGNENGLFVVGRHFTKGVVVDVLESEYLGLKARYAGEFEFHEPIMSKDRVKAVVIEEPKPVPKPVIGDVDGDGDVDIKDVMEVVKNVGKGNKGNKKKA